MTSDVIVEIAARPDEPRLYWIGTQAPDNCYHRVPDELRPLLVFVTSMANAIERVDILDSHFDLRYGLPVIEQSLIDTVARVRILSSERGELVRWIKENSPRLDEKLRDGELQVGFVERARVHDRFALVDADLWHFGSTVGGAYPALSAVSHGWFTHVERFSWRFIDEWGKGTSNDR